MQSLEICFAILLVAMTGCRDIVGFDETAPGDAAVRDGVQAMPFLPFTPTDEHKEPCTRCATDECTTEHQACLEDASCLAMLRCRGTCSDPACNAACGSFELLDYSVSGLRPGRRGAENENFIRYHHCVSLTRCSDVCGAGVDWDCKKGYRWPIIPDRFPFRVQVELLDILGSGVSARVTGYVPAFPGMPSALTQSAQTAGWGQTELEFTSTGQGLFLQIESGPEAVDEFRMLDYSGPFFRDTRLSRNVFQEGFPPVFPQPGFAGVFIVATDCLDSPAPGITFEIVGASGKAYAYTPYTNFSFGANTDQSGMGGFADVTPANGMVTVLAKRDDEIVARQRVYLRENWLTSIVLRALSEDD
jgi:hypothetical protein